MMVPAYLLMCLIFGTTFLAIKVGLNEGLPPFTMATLRFLIAAMLVLAFLTFVKKLSWPKKASDYVEITLLGILQTTIPFAALFWAEQHVSSGTAALLVATAPIFIGLMSRIDRGQWLGVLIALGGVYLIVFPDMGASDGTWVNDLAKGSIIVSEIAFAYGVIRSKRFLATGISPQIFNGLQMLFASLVLGLAALTMEQPSAIEWTTTGTLSLIYLTVVASVLASGIYYWLLKVTNPLFPSTWTYVSPIIAMLAGALVLNEQLTVLGVTGALLVIGGVVVMNVTLFRSLWQLYKKKDKSPTEHKASVS